MTSASSTAFVQAGGTGAQTLSLRGLGPNRTLVLLNGRRAGPAGTRGETSPFMQAAGFATLEWDSVVGADSYVVLRDGLPVGEPVRMEGSVKRWTDRVEEKPKTPTPQTTPPPVTAPTFTQ